MNIKIGIYKIENLINNKVYIGQSKNIYKRWYGHRCDCKTKEYPLYQAIRKYGIENFHFSILEECKIEKLSEREDYWMNYYHSLTPNGYNINKAETHYTNLAIPQQYLDIIEDIETSELKLKDIATKYNMSSVQIGRINNGKAWRLDGKSYPLRGHQKLDIEIIQQMILSNLSISDIAAALSVTVPTLKGFLKKENIQIKDIREPFTSNKKIAMYDLNGELIKEFISAKRAAEFLKENPKNNLELDSYRIAILRNSKKNREYKGYIWREVE